MPRNGTGVRKIPRINGIASLPSVTWATPGTTIRADQHNGPFRDVEAMLTNSLPRDGSAPMAGDLPMGGRRITGLASASMASDAVRYDQVVKYTPFLDGISSLPLAADSLIYVSTPQTAAVTPFTPFARSLLAGANASEARTSLELEAATQAEWNTGTSIIERIISPSKLLARIRALFSINGAAPAFAVRGWVTFDGTTTPPVIRSSGNIASVVRDGGTGKFRVNFTTPLPAGYAVSGLWRNNPSDSPLGQDGQIVPIVTDAGYARILLTDGSANLRDGVYVSMIFVG